MQVTIESVKPAKSGWTDFLDTNNLAFTIPPDKGTVIKGGVYEIKFTEKDTQYGKKKYITNLSQVSAPSTTTAPVHAPVSNGNGKYSSEDKEAFARKDLWIARMNALTNSVEMTKILFDVAKANGDDMNFSAKVTQQKVYEEFLAEITK